MLINSSVTSLTTKLVLSLILIGCLATVAGFAGAFYPVLSILLIIPFGILAFIFIKNTQSTYKFSPFEKFTLVLIVIWWLLHSLQVFVPETGFDALWYHLPIAHGVVEQHRFYIDQERYQSFNPLFSDSIFYLGYMAAGELGTKIVAYMFGLSLMSSTYALSRKLLSRQFSLLVVLIISGFQVISWQSSSFYIDIAKAFWEISALVFILERKTLSSGLAFGASLASKVFSLLLLPTMIVIEFINNSKRTTVLVGAVSLLIAAPYYWFSYTATGNPIYSATNHLEKLDQIGGEGHFATYLIKRNIELPLLPIEVATTREYTSFLMILLLPLGIIYHKKIKKDKVLLSLLIFTVSQLLLWWYVPPLSVRYALSGFITGLVLTIYLLVQWWKENKLKKTTLIVPLLIFGVIFMPIRLLIAVRSWQYLSGTQTNEQYLQQFLDGNIDTVLKKWHQL